MFENGRAWFSLRFFSYREWVRCLIVQLSFKKSFAVSSIDSRMKPSRHKLNSLSPVLPWMKMFAWISASGAGVIWGLKKGNVGALLCLVPLPPGQPGPMASHCTSELAAKLMLSLQAALIFCSLKTVLFSESTPVLIFLGCWQINFRVPSLNTLYWVCLACLGLSELWWFV